ncbi:uncharacterized protein LOC113554603 isoform X1 [Rhopalosiphum maidis]|uniref:uncharacterized protein LOC113554603 isoform X1 n=1 Tax=Rhopalosiphum maidis TaxID=43146 RepID=UPI000EFFE59B|nr:uncharacterized protein LOC113554603 isoform X1 [Rhopalosiphum maidis]
MPAKRLGRTYGVIIVVVVVIAIASLPKRMHYNILSKTVGAWEWIVSKTMMIEEERENKCRALQFPLMTCCTLYSLQRTVTLKRPPKCSAIQIRRQATERKLIQQQVCCVRRFAIYFELKITKNICFMI